MTLESRGNYEVRLIDPSDAARDNEKAFWIELVDLVGKVCLDSYGSDDLEQIAHAAQEFIEQARVLSSK